MSTLVYAPRSTGVKRPAAALTGLNVARDVSCDCRGSRLLSLGRTPLPRPLRLQKVAQGSLEALCKLAEGLEEGFAHLLPGVWSPLVERLGDAKAALKERAVDLAVAIAT
eukprot:6112269-Pleurochrysis_carterae.AAC.2